MEKEKVLAKIEQINSILVDKEKMIPISGKIFIIWGVAISIVIFLIPYIFENQNFSINQKLFYSLISFIVIFGITFIFEYFIVKKENTKAGFKEFTKLQKDIETTYILSVIIGVILTLALAITGGSFFIFSIWFFLIGMAYYSTGIMFKSIFKTYAIVLIGAGTLLTIYGIILITSNLNLTYQERSLIHKDIFLIGKYLTLVVLGFGHIILGLIIQKDKKVV